MSSTVFRWNITKREQLGGYVTDGPAEVPAAMLDELRRCSARVIAAAGDARLVFVGRSPEQLYDYLTGAFAATSWSRRLTLFNVSLKAPPWAPEWAPDAAAYAALRDYFTAHALDPRGIAENGRPIALVDLVWSGETFGNIVDLLVEWTSASGLDWRAVRRHLRLVGITERVDDGPRTSRWWDLEWAGRLRPSSLKGVSVPYWFWTHLGDSSAKVSASYPWYQWGDPKVAHPPRGIGYSDAVRVAVALHEAGRSRRERHALASQLAALPVVKHRWCRRLMSELRGTSRRRQSSERCTRIGTRRTWPCHVRFCLFHDPRVTPRLQPRRYASASRSGFCASRRRTSAASTAHRHRRMIGSGVSTGSKMETRDIRNALAAG